ncbi:MAG: ribonuclease P protein component [Gallionellaceae bacterium]|nr:ribonuclease P protein component [Gallionellaceae bacterium]
MQNSLYSSKSAEFTAKYRLLLEDGFDHVVKAKSVSGRCFKIFFGRNDKKNARLGIIASKKALSRAVDRNCVKRVVREVFRQHCVKDRSLDVVVVVRHAYLQQPTAQRGDLEKLFSRVDNQCAES